MQAYISGPLHAAKDLEKARSFYEFLATVCTQAGIEAYVPHMHTDPVRQAAVSDEDVFRTDYAAMCNAAVIIAAIGEASSGVGAELGVAYQAGIPVIGLFRTGERPSRFLLGMLKDMPRAMVFSFAHETECASRLQDALRELSEAGEALLEGRCTPRSGRRHITRSKSGRVTGTPLGTFE